MSSIAFFDFVPAINARDAERLHSLMTPDHTLVDPIGNRVNGADACKNAWSGYFQLFPDYALELVDAVETPAAVFATGWATGAFRGTTGLGDRFRIPAAWKATMSVDKVSVWQVFADTKVPFEIIERNTLADAGPRATSVGGIFFKCREPEKLKEWYGRHLGFRVDAYGTSFGWRQWDNRQKGFTAWSPFPPDTTYFSPSTKDFMFNYRVVHIEELVARLRADGVTVLDNIEVYPYGKFVHILDPEDNKIELWEADDEQYAKILGAVTR